MSMTRQRKARPVGDRSGLKDNREIPPANYTSHSAVAAFSDAIATAGITPPERIIADGKRHRFSTNGKASDKAGHYKLHLDGIPAGHFGCWRAGIDQTWRADIGRKLTDEEAAAHRRRAAEMQRQRKAEEARGHTAAAKEAAGLLKSSQPATTDHLYLKRKGVKAYGTGVNTKGELLVPMRDADGNLWNLECIAPEKPAEGPDKKGLFQGKRLGCFFTIGDLTATDIVCIAEGFSTGASVREATGQPVVVAFNAGNLVHVAKAIRGKYPDIPMLICGDDDYQTTDSKGRPYNPGRTKAEAAAKAVGGRTVYPDFGTDRPDGATDFNDLHQARGLGLEAVTAQMEKARQAAMRDAEITRLTGLEPLEYDRERENVAKDIGVRVGTLDKAVKAARKKADTPRNSAGISKYPSYPLDSLSTGAVGFETPSKPLHHPFTNGVLLEDNGNGGLRRVIESKAAEIVAGAMCGKVAWDGEARSWFKWRSTHWEPLLASTQVDKQFADAVHVGTAPMGYRVNYLNGLVTIIQKRGLLPPPDSVNGVIPFANGLLDIATGDLVAATPERALPWVLPHRYDPIADCPTVKAWLLRSVEGDQATVELLRAWLAALLIGIPLQKFLLLLGRGGSGKGTFQRLAMELVGARNAAISTLRDLEENRFETAKLFGKRLCMINEAGKHGGALNMLKAITGGDAIPLERKHVQQTGSFTFSGLVLMATNEDLQSTDSTSGLERRRITVNFPKTATAEEKADWMERGGEAAVLHAEIPGLIRWLLDLPVAAIHHAFEHLPPKIQAANMLGMQAGNSVANWMIENTAPDPTAWTQTGDKRERREPGTGAIHYEHAEDWLYPNYLQWCLRAGRNRPVALAKFKATVRDMVETLGHPVELKQHPEKRTQGVKGLKLDDSEGVARGWNRGITELSHCSESTERVGAKFTCVSENCGGKGAGQGRMEF